MCLLEARREEEDSFLPKVIIMNVTIVFFLFFLTHRPQVGLDLDGRAADGGLAGRGGHGDLDEGGGLGKASHLCVFWRRKKCCGSCLSCAGMGLFKVHA